MKSPELDKTQLVLPAVAVIPGPAQRRRQAVFHSGPVLGLIDGVADPWVQLRGTLHEGLMPRLEAVECN